jgi:peptidoglycan/xylan/chitin deacetylase (PgdA/CDA1 family)
MMRLIERRGGSSIRQRAVPILMYHEISAEFDPSFRKYVVSPRAFARQMQLLRVAGYTPITMDTLVTARASRASLPRRPVLITFDDGFRDGVSYAADVLRSQGFPATFFLVAGLMGQASEWEHDSRRRRAWWTGRRLASWWRPALRVGRIVSRTGSLPAAGLGDSARSAAVAPHARRQVWA